MSLLTNPLQSGLLLQQAVLPYTFTTGELDSLKAKLQSAENQILQSPNKQNASMLPMTGSEIRTLLRMIDMTYLQGLSGSGHYVSDCGTNPSNTNGISPAMLHNQLTANNQLLQHTLQQQSAINNNQNILNQLQQHNQNGLNNPLSHHNNNNNNMLSGNTSLKNPPPPNYICHKCNISGHWIQECPLNTSQQQDYTKPPPANYVCHRCGIPSHWIKNCPTNGNPNYDNKPHLSGHGNKSQQSQQSISNDPSQQLQQQIQLQQQTNNDQQQQQQLQLQTQQQQQQPQQSTDGQPGTQNASQPPSKKRRLNQM